jgi:hypothetical protein
MRKFILGLLALAALVAAPSTTLIATNHSTLVADGNGGGYGKGGG